MNIMDPSNILKSLEYDTDFSSEVDDDFLDPDFGISIGKMTNWMES